VAIATGGTQRLTVNSSGNTQTVGTISVGNATPSTSGAGITFPATQSASSDANTLDDYEEGTWSPTVTAQSGSFTTVTVNRASYTKIGRVVTASFSVAIVNAGTAAGAMFLTLPFSPSLGDFVGAVREDQATGTMGQIVMNNNVSVIAIYSYINTTLIASSRTVIGSITYFV
jgi:hypothetical protein